MNQPDIPVYLGEELPLVRPYVDAMDTHGEDGLGESHYPEITNGTINTDGVGFLARTLHEAAQKEEPVSIIALGPLTNLARLVQNDPESLAGLGELISMGGSCQSHGNCSPVAEYNYWCDPHAAEIVYRAFEELPVLQDKQIHMVGLDVTIRRWGNVSEILPGSILIFTGNRKESSAVSSMIRLQSLTLSTVLSAAEWKPVRELQRKVCASDRAL